MRSSCAENDYALCVYDASSDPQPLKSFVMRAGEFGFGLPWANNPPWTLFFFQARPD